MRIFVTALAGLVIAALAAPAHAGIAYTSYGVLNNQNVTVTFADHTTERGGAGRITLYGTSMGNLNVWCVDLFHNLASSGDFTTQTPHAYDDVTYGKVSALISHGTPLLGGDYNASAALQIAIWIELFGPANTIVADNHNVDILAATYVANVTNGTWTADPHDTLFVLSATGNQSQAYIARVPEPAGMALLGIGLAGMVAARQRQAAQRFNTGFL